jgi:hypothetical protein
MTTTLQATSSDEHRSELVGAAAARMYAAELALHTARQAGVDSWIAAAYETLHRAIAEHRSALNDRACSGPGSD